MQANVSRAQVRVAVGGVIVLFDVATIAAFASCKLDDERSHGHFDVELYHVDNGVEENVDELVLEEHEAN